MSERNLIMFIKESTIKEKLWNEDILKLMRDQINYIPISLTNWCMHHYPELLVHAPLSGGKICQKTFETFETYTISNVVFSSGCTVIRGTCFRILVHARIPGYTGACTSKWGEQFRRQKYQKIAFFHLMVHAPQCAGKGYLKTEKIHKNSLIEQLICE